MTMTTIIESGFKDWMVSRDLPNNGGSLRNALQMRCKEGRAFLTILWLVLAAGTASAQTTYKQPPKEVLDVLNARVTPGASISPARDYMLLIESAQYPPISVIARPMLRLAGLRIDPSTNGRHIVNYDVALTLKRIA